MESDTITLKELAWQAMRERREADALGFWSRLEATPDVHHEMALCYYNLGEITRSMEHSAAAVQGGAGRNAVLFRAVALPQSPLASAEDVLAARRELAGLFPLKPGRTNSARTSGPLRVGFFCAYFHDPGWMKPVWALINALDRAQCRIFLYSDAPGRSFASGYAAHDQDAVRETGSLDAEDCADCMKADALDVLIDLNGHSQAERMAVLQLRPARHVAGWFNYYATSGLDGVEALIADDIVAPPGQAAECPERILRLPLCYLTFTVNYPVPPVSPLPCLEGNPFTWGCLTALYKITPTVVAEWSRLLHATPGTRLLVRNGGLATECNREHLAARFAACGIGRDRLLLEGPVRHYEFLEQYARIDVQLDPWPYTGGTTTSESLWQGVPVLTRTGSRWIERVSHSLLHSAGMEEWVAHSPEEWLEKARGWASPERRQVLADLRLGLRGKLTRSPLCDAPRLARTMLELLHSLCAVKF